MSADLPRPRIVGVHDASFHDAWSQALSDLELDVRSCEQLLASLHEAAAPDALPPQGSWSPPTSLGPLPLSLVERARTILARQLQVAEQLAEAAVRSQQHLELQRRMRPDDAVSRPLFVDAAF